MKNTKDIPLLFIHTGNQDYLKTTIEQASKYNKNVYLIGDDANKSFCPNWISVDEFSDEAYNKFERNYIHMSSNAEKFELSCFRRYFLAYEFLEKYGYDEFMLLDSDLLVYKNFSDLNLKKYDVALSIQKNQEPYIWTISVHCSYWKKYALKSFLEYLISAYITDIDKLQAKWAYHEKNHVEGGICDMTLVYLWYNQNQNLNVYNTAQIHNGAVFDHFLSASEGYETGDFKVIRRLEMKKLKFSDNIPYFYSPKNGWVQAYTIHAQGKRKMYINQLYHCNNGYVHYLAAKIYRKCHAGFQKLQFLL